MTVLDEFTRESLCIRVERRLRSEDVRLTLESLFKDYGTPMYLRSDNGSEFIARCLQGWLETQGTQPLFIEPGSPWQNGKCESFNGRFRDECLNLEWFESLKEAQVVIEAWRDHYNQERPHSAKLFIAPPIHSVLAAKAKHTTAKVPDSKNHFLHGLSENRLNFLREGMV